MTVQFRNLDFDPAAPLNEWPAEAIETVIDRGSLSDWRRLAEARRELTCEDGRITLRRCAPGAPRPG
jgi:hypothetical protein